MTFPQIEVCTEAIVRWKVRQLDEVLRPLLSAFDTDYKAPSVSDGGRGRGGRRGRGRVTTTRSDGVDYRPYAVADPAMKEAALLTGFMALGIPVTVKTGGAG